MPESQFLTDQEIAFISQLALDLRANKGKLLEIAGWGDASIKAVLKAVLRHMVENKRIGGMEFCPDEVEAGKEICLEIGKRRPGILAMKLMPATMDEVRRPIAMWVLESVGRAGSEAVVDIILKSAKNPEQQGGCIELLVGIGEVQGALVRRKMAEHQNSVRMAFPDRRRVFGEIRARISEHGSRRELEKQAFGGKQQSDPPQGYVKINGIRRQAH